MLKQFYRVVYYKYIQEVDRIRDCKLLVVNTVNSHGVHNSIGYTALFSSFKKIVLLEC